jgi:hypothetical protein
MSEHGIWVLIDSSLTAPHANLVSLCSRRADNRDQYRGPRRATVRRASVLFRLRPASLRTANEALQTSNGGDASRIE